MRNLKKEVVYVVTVVPEGDEGPGWSGCAQEWRGQWAGLQMLGVLSVQVLVEAAGRCVSETRKMRMRPQGLGRGAELERRAMRKEMEPTMRRGDAGSRSI